MRPEIVLASDLEVDSGASRVFDGPLFVNGWVTIRSGGAVRCAGKLSCLGLTLESDAVIACEQLATNVLEVLGSKPPKLEGLRFHSRVVHHERFALRDLIDKDVVKADYIQHAGGNGDYVRGVNPLAEKFFEARSEGDPVVFEIELMRAAFRDGKSVFRRLEPLVPPRSKLAVSAATREELVDELKQWLEAHPGPQRATLEALEAEWTTKLSGLSAEARTDAMFVIRRVIKSPKLTDRLDALQAVIGL